MSRSLLHKIVRRWHRHRLERLSLPAMRERLRQRSGLVVLCYHSVRDDLPDYPYAVTCDAFRRHLQFVNENFQVGDAQAAYELLSRRQSESGRPMALVTFDDGYADNLENATPILEEFSTPALLFAAKYPVTSGFDTFLSQEQLGRLAAHPLWTVGAHGTAHLSLTSLLPSDVERDIDECVAWLESVTRMRPRWFAYPYGRHTSNVLAMAGSRFTAAFEVTASCDGHVDVRRIPRTLITSAETTERSFARALVRTRFLQVPTP